MSLREMLEKRKTIILKEPLVKRLGSFHSKESSHSPEYRELTRDDIKRLWEEKERVYSKWEGLNKEAFAVQLRLASKYITFDEERILTERLEAIRRELEAETPKIHAFFEDTYKRYGIRHPWKIDMLKELSDTVPVVKYLED
jgi:hypothetical protein